MMTVSPYVLFLLTIFGTVIGIKDGLYSTEDNDVVPLTFKTFQDQVINSKPGIFWVVEFYNSWCGHCIHFAPTWKKIAQYYRDHNWQDLVVIAGVDCSQAANLDTCRQFDIQGYPTMKIFPPVGTPDRLKSVETLKNQNEQELKQIILEFITKYGEPGLQPLKKIEDIWSENKLSHEQVLLLFEEKDSLLGQLTILDLRKLPEVLLRRMLKEDVEKFGIHKFPSLYRFNNDSTYALVALGTQDLESDREKFVTNIVHLLKRTDKEAILPFRKKTDPPGDALNKDGQQAFKKMTQVHFNSSMVSMQDLESALHYSFRQEIAICKHIEGAKFESLRNFVLILLKYFPGRPAVHGFLSRIHIMLLNLQQQSLSGESWMDRIDRLQDDSNFLPEVIHWEACAGSLPRYRGYPCAMWTLFHTLTVEAYSQNKLSRASNPQEVLKAVSSYMEHFFGCKECVKNFQLMARTLDSEVNSQADSVLWLWSAHNKANKRLHGDISEDPKHLKVQFPPPSLCPFCRNAGGKEGENLWNKEEVLKFLLQFYSREKIFMSDNLATGSSASQSLTFEKESELDWWEGKQMKGDLERIGDMKERHLGVKKVEKEERSGLWGMTQIDLSMCVIFYLTSTLIILMLYHHFIIRRHMRPCSRAKHTLISA